MRFHHAALALTALLATTPTLPAADLHLEPCDLPGVEVDARCGTYEVFEDRDARSGRTIPLRVVLLPATGDDPAPDPVVPFGGGPGESTVGMAGGVATIHAEDLARRDFLLVDYRGTGESGALFCPYQEERTRGVAEALETFMPVDRIDECREALSAEADLTQYTTPNVVDDVAEVARALGYERVNLFGGSYGTRAALVFMRRHPEMVRTAILQGVAPTDARIPVTFARDAQAALDGWLRECAGDAACAAAFPDPAGYLAMVTAELEAGPKIVEVVDPKTRERVELALTPRAFVQTLRYLLYTSLGALKIPAYLHAAAEGDWEPLAQSAYTVAGLLMHSVPDGLYLSVVCSEDVARVGPNAAAVQTGFLGDFRLRQQVAACAGWPRGELPEGYFAPVVSEVPVLILSGERDPVTPARWGYQVQEFLPRSVHAVVPDGGHGWFGLPGAECLDELTSRLLETGSVEGLDVEGCVGGIERPPFLLEIPRDEELEMTPAALERFAGTYVAEGGGLRATLEVTGEGLIATFGEDTARLVPVAPLRFRAEGDPPGDFFRFVEEDGEMRAFEVVRGGSAVLTLVRRADPE